MDGDFFVTCVIGSHETQISERPWPTPRTARIFRSLWSQWAFRLICTTQKASTNHVWDHNPITNRKRDQAKQHKSHFGPQTPINPRAQQQKSKTGPNKPSQIAFRTTLPSRVPPLPPLHNFSLFRGAHVKALRFRKRAIAS